MRWAIAAAAIAFMGVIVVGIVWGEEDTIIWQVVKAALLLGGMVLFVGVMIAWAAGG